MKIITKKQVLLLHEHLLRETGGAAGLRDEGLLDSAVSAPFQSFDGTELFPTVIEKAARLCFGLVKNHAFIDGNKRIGAHSMLVFLAVNDTELTYTQEELTNIILGVASGKIDYEDLLSWIKNHIDG
ncbi:MAG: type II toxin-antitoxin system death-on-curing family toxin [Clostridia bacterium]|nr:type II toxin-antitoxin system death-on-curing family toxin [Clostridia bacterium]